MTGDGAGRRTPSRPARRTGRADGPGPVRAAAAARHVLPDVLAPGLRVVFCGTAAGSASARKRAFYAGPGNRFWPMLHATGLTRERLAPRRFRHALRYGIGLTDLAKHVSGADAALRRADFRRWPFVAKMRRCRPLVLAFNGKKAASMFFGVPTRRIPYGPMRPRRGFPWVFVLPSTSRAANGAWDPAPWYALARATRGWRRRAAAVAAALPR